MPVDHNTRSGTDTAAVSLACQRVLCEECYLLSLHILESCLKCSFADQLCRLELK